MREISESAPKEVKGDQWEATQQFQAQVSKQEDQFQSPTESSWAVDSPLQERQKNQQKTRGHDPAGSGKATRKAYNIHSWMQLWSFCDRQWAAWTRASLTAGQYICVSRRVWRWLVCGRAVRERGRRSRCGYWGLKSQINVAYATLQSIYRSAFVLARDYFFWDF